MLQKAEHLDYRLAVYLDYWSAEYSVLQKAEHLDCRLAVYLDYWSVVHLVE